MLNQNQSKKSNSWKYITVFPALVAFVFLFQIEVVAQEKETPKQENETKSVDLKSFKIEKDLISLSEGKEIYIDGKKSSQEELDKLDPDEIEGVDVAKISGKKTILVTTKNNTNKINKTIKVTDKTIYIDGIKSTNEEFSKLDKNNIDKIDVNTFENTVKITTKKEVFKNENKVAEIEFIITKNTTDEEIKEKCEQIKNLHNIDLTFINIKRNNNGEITNIESKNDVFPRSYKQSKNPIEPFKFFYEKKTNGGITAGYTILSNSISRIIDDKLIDYKKAVIVIDGEQSDYQDLEKVNPKEVRMVRRKDINSRWPENKKYLELYGEKALYGTLIEVQTNEYYNKNN